MTKDALQWLLLAASNAPIRDTNEARFKGQALAALADMLDEVVAPPSA